MAYTIKTTDEIINQIKINLVTNIDGINDANIGSILDIFVSSLAQELEEQYTDLNTIYNSTRISTASADDLDELGLLLGVTRNEGQTAQGTVTLMRNYPATNDFIISSGTILSTQPGSDVEQYKYVTTSNQTFYKTILNETQTFINGIYVYKLDQRFVSSVSSLSGTVSSSANTFTQNTDYTLSKNYLGLLINPDTYSLVDNCETVNWTAGDEADTETLNTSIYYQGSKAFNLLKSGVTTSVMSYYKVLSSSIDLTSKTLFFDLYIANSTILAKINNLSVTLGTGSGTTNSYNKVIANTTLSTGWNRVCIDLSTSYTYQGTPDLSNINYLKLTVNTVSISNTFSTGELILDHWFNATYEPSGLSKDVIIFDKSQTIPDNNSTLNCNYIPLSLDVPVIASEIGVDYNVQVGKVIYKITNISNIDRVYNYSAFTGGLDIEGDDDYRENILKASSLQNTSTISAIKANVESLSFISSATVEDMPETTASEVVFTYNSAIDKYTLPNSVAIDDSNLTVGDSTGASDYSKDTDFSLTVDNEIDWGIGGTTPTNGNSFYVNYHYNKLGYFKVTVVGINGALTSSQITELNTLVNSIKSSGIKTIVSECSYVSISVTVTVTVKSGYDSSIIKENVNEAIKSYISSLKLGEDVLLAGIVAASMSVEGVSNIVVTDIGGGTTDYTISNTESAINGIHTIN